MSGLPTNFPTPPTFSDEKVEQCRQSGDYIPLLFEWYRFVGALAITFACLNRESPRLKSIPDRQYHVLAGLLTRCSRLMLSNMALSHEGKFGETTAIVDRCIFESAVKIVWLCGDTSDERFARYVADGLRTELELKSEIGSRVDARNGSILPIESRMLTSISNHIAAAELTENEIIATKRLPDLASMLTTIGLTRLSYVVAQRIGSHHIHGTWPSLLFHYLEQVEEGEGLRLAPRDHDCPTHINQFMSTSMIVLRALAAYSAFAIEDEGEATKFDKLFESYGDEIMRVYTEAKGGSLGN